MPTRSPWVPRAHGSPRVNGSTRAAPKKQNAGSISALLWPHGAQHDSKQLKTCLGLMGQHWHMGPQAPMGPLGPMGPNRACRQMPTTSPWAPNGPWAYKGTWVLKHDKIYRSMNIRQNYWTCIRAMPFLLLVCVRAHRQVNKFPLGGMCWSHGLRMCCRS